MPTRYRPIAFFLLVVTVLVLLLLGLRDRPDPRWEQAGAIVRVAGRAGGGTLFVGQSVDSLRALYADIHGAAAAGAMRDEALKALVATPRLPVIEWRKFRHFAQTLARQRLVVLSGVTSTGATNLAARTARLMAGGDPARLLEISAAPQFDLELHYRYIGREDAGGQFVPGELLRFWEACRDRPDQRFVAVIDNFDKINPETFFGPVLWEALSSARDTARLGGRAWPMPPNFCLISVTKIGPGAFHEFNEEHFKRLGRPYVLHPNALELLEHVRRQEAGWKARADTSAVAAANLEALHDTAAMQQFLFYFLKTNDLIAKHYGRGYQLGQGSNVRSFFRPDQRRDLQQTFMLHLNALRPAHPLDAGDFAGLDYTIRGQGLEPESSLIARQVQWLQDRGYFVEIIMVAATALLTALVGWGMFRRREQLIRRYGDRTQAIFHAFETQQLQAEVAFRRLEEIKREVNQLVLERKLNYTEGLYFLAFIEDKSKRIEFARNVSENFLELFNAFMEDGVLTHTEYNKLQQFLKSIRHKIPPESFESMREKVTAAARLQLGRIEQETPDAIIRPDLPELED